MSENIFMGLLFGAVILLICLFIISLAYDHKTNNWRKVKINDAKQVLADNGILFNHSYKLVHKTKDCDVRYIRVFSVYYYKGNVYARAYFTSAEGEIGTWTDKIEHLYIINKKYDLTDCGEWNVKNN